MEGVKKGGFFIYRLYGRPELRQEATELKAKAEKVKMFVENSYSKSGKSKKFEGSAAVFFNKCMSDLTLSKEMEYLLQCFVLTVVRNPRRQDDRGVVYTDTAVSRLAKLSPRIVDVDVAVQTKITEMWKRECTASSVGLLREEAEKTTLLNGEEKAHMLFMLSPAMTRTLQPDLRYEPKTYGCLFYEYRAILSRLSEEQGVVCFKNIVKEASPFALLLQPQEGSFTLIPDKGYCSLNKNPVVVFEGVIALSKEAFGKWITHFGLCKAILACAAIEPPYEKDSKPEDIKDEKARKEILSYREIYEKEVRTFLVLDHVYCNTLQEEVKI